MACRPCQVAGALALNALIVLDVVVNFLLAGRPPETISQRIARLRESGSKTGTRLCAALTWTAHLFGAKGDHCTSALDPTTHDGTELWPWS